jgi:transcriptional regulator with XRE-family HTH domain
MESLPARFLKLIKETTGTQLAFSKATGISVQNLNGVVRGRNNPGFEVLSKLVKTYPYLNLNWVLNGLGEMWFESVKNTLEITKSAEVISRDVSHQQAQIEFLQSQLSTMLQLIETLQNSLNRRDEKIENLENQISKSSVYESHLPLK